MFSSFLLFIWVWETVRFCFDKCRSVLHLCVHPVEEKIHLCLWEFSGTLGEEMQPIIWAWMLDLGGKMDQTWVLGYLGMVGDCEGII